MNFVQVTQSNRLSKPVAIVSMLLLVALLSLPYWGGRSDMRLMTEFFYLLAIAQMWNLLAGYGGLISAGQQAFVGIGGYSLLVFSSFGGLHPLLAIPLGGVIAAITALVAGALLFRLKGAHFAVGTWVVAEVFRLLISNLSTLGGGSGTSFTNAVSGIPIWTRNAMTFWAALALGVGSMLVLYMLLRSKNGLALTAMKDAELASRSLGVRTERVKWVVYLFSAFGCGLAGALIFLTKLRISPNAAFDINWTAIMFFIVIIGGIGSLEGPIIGCIVYFLLRSFLADFGSWYMIALGLITIILMLKMPKGIWGWAKEKWNIEFFPVQRRVSFQPKPKTDTR